MAKFVTDTDVPLTVEINGTRVTITGDREKVLYDGGDALEAQAVYDAVKEHYAQRKFARDEGIKEGAKVSPEKAEELAREMEGKVGFVRVSGADWQQNWERQKVDVDKAIGRGDG